MHIDETTKISALIKHNPATIDAIASISKNFEKLKNPLLRKILASRVNISQAARIGNSTVDVFFEKLAPLGFTVKKTNVQDQPSPKELPDKSHLAQRIIKELDVRDMLKSGKDPFNPIMEALSNLEEGHALKIINTFEPTPLISILSKKGYEHHTVVIEKQLVHTYFAKTTIQSPAAVSSVTALVDEIETVLSGFENKTKEVDVRHLEMPQPMITILNALDSLPEDHLLLVHHKKVPQFLFPQLSEKGYKWYLKEDKPGNVTLLIFKHA